jgi:hypothetical protein
VNSQVTVRPTMFPYPPPTFRGVVMRWKPWRLAAARFQG